MPSHARLRQQLANCVRRVLGGEAPAVPEAGRLLWSFFVELAATRTYHIAGPHPISYAEIEAWARLNRWSLEPHHVAILRTMDDAWLDHAYSKQGRGQGAALQSSGQKINPTAFDAVFG